RRSARTAPPPRRCTGWSGRRRWAASPWGPPWSRAGSASPTLPPESPPSAVRSRGTELPLLRFLERLAVDAERGHRARLQPLEADVRPAVLALAVRAVLDAPERLVDLRDELALAVADAEEEVAVAFQRGAIGGVGALLAVLPHAVEGARGFVDQLLALVSATSLTRVCPRTTPGTPPWRISATCSPGAAWPRR